MASKQLNTHLVTIKRGHEEIATTVTDIDLRILRRLHPRENIKVVEKDVGVVGIEDNATALHQQLERKFDTKNKKIVREVFQTPYQLAQEFGLGLGMDSVDAVTEGPKQSKQRDAKADERKAEARANKAAKAAGGATAKPGKDDGKA